MSIPDDPFALAHPELRAALPALIARDPVFPGGADHVLSPAETDAMLPVLRRRWVLDGSHVPQAARAAPTEMRWVPGLRGAPPVKVWVIGAGRPGCRPAIVHMHGGGFVVGRAEDYLPVLQAQSLALDCIILSVEYRLAPETPFPGALKDNYAVLEWLWDNAAGLGADRDRIAVQGESAGGGHAAALAILARNRGEVPVIFQCLTYPMLDDRTGSASPLPGHIGLWCWTAKYNRMGWSALLGQPAGGDRVPPGAVPAREADLRHLPAAFIWVGGLDLFLDEDIDFARRLSLAGVAVELHVMPGVFHGFDGAAPGARLTADYRMAMARALAGAFGTGLAPAAELLLGAG